MAVNNDTQSSGQYFLYTHCHFKSFIAHFDFVNTHPSYSLPIFLTHRNLQSLHSNVKHYPLSISLRFGVAKVIISEENRTPTGEFVELGGTHHSGESDNNGEENLQWQLLDQRLAFNEIDRRIIEIVAPLSTQLKALIRSVKELSEKSSIRSNAGKRSQNDRGRRVNVGIAGYFEIAFCFGVIFYCSISRETQHF